ncbi:hypothetical protein [Hominibacterium faecale]|uniref:hypothetical protein n=1 Tax=Hominibacterium faecale TaxID=2839743 RepID=UPI0022B29E0E|nr:hypothetical protein [Hominibacterium faecale]
MLKKGKAKNRIMCLILIAALLAGSGSLSYGQTANQKTKEFANLVLFVQLDGDPSKNFMETRTTGYNPPTYAQLARKYWLDESYAKSLPSYLTAISYGQFHVTSYLPQDNGTTIVPVMGSGSTDYDLISAAVKANVSLQGSDLDRDGNGFIDNVTVIVQGKATNDATDPHKSWDGHTPFAGKTIGNYNIINSSAAFEGAEEGVIAHEFLHSIGFPDLYSNDGTDPVGDWDIMSKTSTYLQYPLAYLRYKSGWLTIDTIASDRTGLTLVPADQPAGDQAYILKSPMSDTEFFVVEYRKKTDSLVPGSLDAKIPGTGLIVYRVNTDVENLTNMGSEKGIVVFAKDIDVPAKNRDELKDSFFSAKEGRYSFGSKDLDQKTNVLSYSDGRNSGIVLKNIGSPGDTISFDVEFADVSDQGIWKNLGPGKIENSEANEISTAADSSGNLYAAYQKGDFKTYVRKYTKDGWTTLGTGQTIHAGKILIYKDVPYLLCSFGDQYAGQLLKYEGGDWKQAALINGDLTQYTDAVVRDDGIYIGYSQSSSETGNSFIYGIKKFDGNTLTLAAENVAAGDLNNMQLTGEKGSMYMTMRTGTNELVIKKITGSKAAPVPTEMKASSFDTLAVNDKLYLGAPFEEGFSVWSYDGSSWKQESPPLADSGSLNQKLAACGSQVFAASENQTTHRTKVWQRKGEAWEQLGADAEVKEIRSIDLTCSKGNIYLSYINGLGNPIVKYKELPGAEEPPVVEEPDPPAPEPPVVEEPDPPAPEPPVAEKPDPPVIQPPAPEPPVSVEPARGIRFTKASTSSISIGWEKAANISGWDIYRSTSASGKYQKVGTAAASNNSFTDTKLTSGQSYYYKIKAYQVKDSKRYDADFSNIAAATTKPGKTAMKKAKAGKKKAAVRWKKVRGADKYQIYRAVKKNGSYKKVKTVSGKKTSWTNKKLKKGKRYYYKIRAVRYLGGKAYYGAFSKKISVRPR